MTWRLGLGLHELTDIDDGLCVHACNLQQCPPPLAGALAQPEELRDLADVVDAKEALRLAVGVGAHHPGQAERARVEGGVGVGDERLLAGCGGFGEDCFARAMVSFWGR